jgi:hypothetical protein
VTSDYLKQFNFQTDPHPPLSPGLALSDFYIFRPIKGKRAASEDGRAEELVSEVTDITSFISHVTLTDIFCEPEHRQQNGIDMEGDDVD